MSSLKGDVNEDGFLFDDDDDEDDGDELKRRPTNKRKNKDISKSVKFSKSGNNELEI